MKESTVFFNLWKNTTSSEYNEIIHRIVSVSLEKDSAIVTLALGHEKGVITVNNKGEVLACKKTFASILIKE